jgi:hypothetical protein
MSTRQSFICENLDEGELSISTHEKKGEYSLRVLNPVAEIMFNFLPHAKRLKDLKNKKIGLYWNHKARGDVALNRVKELFSDRFEGISFEWFETAISEEASEEWFESVKKSGVHGVIASTGD